MNLPWLAEGKFPLFLAPMSGYTDVVFRNLCKAQGADVLVTEFIPAEMAARDAGKVWPVTAFPAEQRPLGIQLFGSHPRKMAEAARRVADRRRPDFLDLNCGCPAPKITKTKGGASLLRDLLLLEDIAKALVKAVPEIPVTAKIRLGWDRQSIIVNDAVEVLAGAGARAVTIHGRTRDQGYRGAADWSAIAAAAESSPIPVIGNGDIRSPEDLARVRRETKVAGVMIGRAALGDPWIFRRLKAFLGGEPPPAPPAAQERWRALLDYARGLAAHEAVPRPRPNLNWMRARLAHFTKGLPQAKQTRAALLKVSSLPELEKLAASFGNEAAHNAGFV